MLKEETRVLNIDINNWVRPSDTCSSAACPVFCHADSAYLCAGCDAHVHAVNRVASRHDRVRVCEACELAPAAFLCKADNASLCATCDSDIHSANSLARRHHRVPIVEAEPNSENIFETIEDEDEAASWLLINPVNEYLDLVDYNTCNNDNQYTTNYAQKVYGGDSVVPVENEIKGGIQFEMEYDTRKTDYVYPASISHSVSVSSMDVSVVPESTSDVSISHPRPPKGTINLFSSPPIQMPTQLTPMDREARVLRYREKKKTRKFEKTIRYASRKAYAETRPRIKGRFAKRTDVDVEVDQMFASSVLAE